MKLSPNKLHKNFSFFPIDEVFARYDSSIKEYRLDTREFRDNNDLFHESLYRIVYYLKAFSIF